MNTTIADSPAVERGEICVGCDRQTVHINHPAEIDVVATLATYPADELVKLLAFFADLNPIEMRDLIETGNGSVKVGNALTGTEARKIMNVARDNHTRVQLNLNNDQVNYGDAMPDVDPLVYVVAKKTPTIPWDAVQVIDELTGVAGAGLRFYDRARSTRGSMFDALRHERAGHAAAVADQLKLLGFDCVGLRLS